MAVVPGTVVVVTGASRGLGRVIARGLAAAGARVAVLARKGSERQLAGLLDEMAREGVPPANVLALYGDIARRDECEAAVRQVVERFGGLEVLFNNAGLGMDQIGAHVSRLVPFYEVPEDTWRRIVDTNVNGTYAMTCAAIPHLLRARRARIVNLTTSLSTMLRPGMSPYGPSKAAVEAMTSVWAKDLAGTAVTVNALLPGGPSDTDMVTREDFPDRKALIPPTAMVPPAMFLASPESDGITGMRIIAKDWPAQASAEEALRLAARPAAW
jgi:NAD(P)-dependent dehydrogenase (short-subunit alcohol dehydrogenase family)